VLDCDVEAPDAHLFLRPQIQQTRDIDKNIPEIDPALCTYCGQCADACQFNAISILNSPLMPQPRIMVFSDLCHDCGVCAFVCPEHAIHDQPEKIGEIHQGTVTPSLQFAEGLLGIGQPSAAPLINALKQTIEGTIPIPDVVILDAPPGTSCPVVETIRDADLVLLVTEPTPFGMHDLNLMVNLLQQMQKPAAVIVNRDGLGNQTIEDRIQALPYPVIGRLPYSRAFAEVIAGGELLVRQNTAIQDTFRQLVSAVRAKLTLEVSP
jgi:MinD superfamily P-loop ATPase